MQPARKRSTALIIDDEKAIRLFLRATLTAEHFNVMEAGTGTEALALVRDTRPDLVVLDLELPDCDGADLIEPIAARGAPAIIVLSAQNREARKVAVLDLGANDFITKPFGVPEFMARVRTALRHQVQILGGVPVYDDGRLVVDLVNRSVHIDGVDPNLTPREYALLRELVIHAGKLLTHHHLMTNAWAGTDEPTISSLRVHIRNLRQKIEETPQLPALIVSEQGIGYRLLPKRNG